MSNPTLRSIDPQSVNQNDEVTLRLLGDGFSEGAYAMVAAYVPRTEFVSGQELAAHLTTRITGSTGDKEVKVHNPDGGLSNAKTLRVK